MNDTPSAVVRAARGLSDLATAPILTAFNVIGAAGIASAFTAVQVIGAERIEEIAQGHLRTLSEHGFPETTPADTAVDVPVYTLHGIAASDDDELSNAVRKFLRNNR